MSENSTYTNVDNNIDSRFRSSFDSSQIDVEFVHRFLTQSYWAKGITIDIVTRSINNSLVIGMFDKNDKQVAFARAVTDAATVAYIADVFVDPRYRKQGISKQMLAQLFAHKDLKGLRRMLLATSDAHTLYKRFGFDSVKQIEIMMEKVVPDIYQQSN